MTCGLDVTESSGYLCDVVADMSSGHMVQHLTYGATTGEHLGLPEKEVPGHQQLQQQLLLHASFACKILREI